MKLSKEERINILEEIGNIKNKDLIIAKLYFFMKTRRSGLKYIAARFLWCAIYRPEMYGLLLKDKYWQALKILFACEEERKNNFILNVTDKLMTWRGSRFNMIRKCDGKEFREALNFVLIYMKKEIDKLSRGNDD